MGEHIGILRMSAVLFSGNDEQINHSNQRLLRRKWTRYKNRKWTRYINLHYTVILGVTLHKEDIEKK